MSHSALRSLPAVNLVVDAIIQRYSLPLEEVHKQLTESVKIALEQARAEILSGKKIEFEQILERSYSRLLSSQQSVIRQVINATGIVLHTNLGRSPLAEVAAKAAYDAGRGYLNLELDLATGKRSHRSDAIREGVKFITGAEAGTVVNNCAAATVIVLRALAANQEVIVSRGQLIEIGGSFRIPDIMQVSSATLREVGTTNITRIADYENAISEKTALLMRIHTSNFRVRGFTKAATIEELVELGRRKNIPVVDDAGSGAVIEFEKYGLPGEPVVSDGIKAGADLVLFSGDKLLGGPQAGIIAGRKELIARIEKDPLMRAFRCDKMTLAALEATLQLYRNPDQIRHKIPTIKMLTTSLEELKQRTDQFAKLFLMQPDLQIAVKEDIAYVGGGSLPDEAIPTMVLSLKSGKMTCDELAGKLRKGKPAVMARIQNDQLLFDLRTVREDEEHQLETAIRKALAD